MGKEIIKDLHFPRSGIDVAQAFSKQPNRPGMDGVYARTTAIGLNVRGYSPDLNRDRGGSRPGLRKWMSTIPGGTTWALQELTTIVWK